MYTFASRRYLILKESYDYRFHQLRDDNRILSLSRRWWINEIKTTEDEIRQVSEAFKKTCTDESEEYRRSAFYASSAMVASRRWRKVEEIMLPLVLMSMKSPVQTWSHERCIIRYTGALLEQSKKQEAQDMLLRIQASYATSCKYLLAIESSSLLKESPETVSILDLDATVRYH